MAEGFGQYVGTGTPRMREFKEELMKKEHEIQKT
jgi:hypothetical protein